MKRTLKTAFAMIALAFAGHAAAQVTFYEHEGFSGRVFKTQDPVENFRRFGFNDQASSVSVESGRWEVCDDVGFRGNCVVLRPGNYPSMLSTGLNNRVSSARELNREVAVDNGRYAPAASPPQLILYEHENFTGETFATDREARNTRRGNFSDRASSAVVIGSRWEVCEDARFSGRCAILRPGRYPSLVSMGMNNNISSARPVSASARYDDNRYAPAPQPIHDWRRRNDEQIYEVNVSSVRAVVAEPGQRCWVERSQVQQSQGSPNVGGALIGGIIGGILGHQVGGGTGRDVATVGGAVAGAAIGSNVGRDNQTATQDVQRCTRLPAQARPEYWDVTYNFRGQEHHVQMMQPPGPTILVNDRGEPRV